MIPTMDNAFLSDNMYVDLRSFIQLNSNNTFSAHSKKTESIVG